ncbi:MAG: hypothetical protein COA42_15265 [Alteromonadaceae bacterium]|nr:MAG: hypothetical protein COA42_15265 [Alteromonadaceae bacterium]
MVQYSKSGSDNYLCSLLSLPFDEKVISLSGYVKAKLSTLLPLIVGGLDENCTFQELVGQNGISEEDAQKAVNELFVDFKKVLDLHFYHFEEQIGTIDKLASFLASEIEDIWQPKTPNRIVNMEAEPKSWPWVLPKGIPVQKIKQPIIFLLSSPRSGSTISRLILGAHPQLFSPPELHLLPFTSMGEREAQIIKNGLGSMRSGPVDALMELHGWDFDQANQFYDKQVEEDLPVSEFYRHLMESCGDRILVDKTPSYAYHPKWLSRAEDVFKSAKYICLTRHPYGMMNSFVKLRIKYAAGNMFGPVDDDSWRLAEKWWYTGYKNIIDFFESIPEDRRRSIRFEDVVADTENVFSKVCDFLNIDFSNDILNPYEHHSGAMLSGAGDPDIGKYSKIDSSLYDAWKKTPPPQKLSEETKVLADLFQYPLL